MLLFMGKILDFNQKKQENIADNKDNFDDLLDFMDGKTEEIPEGVTVFNPTDNPIFIEDEDNNNPDSSDFVTNLLRSDINKAGYAKYLLDFEFAEYANFASDFFENKPCKVINHYLLEELLLARYRKEVSVKNLSSKTVKEILDCHKENLY